MPGARVGNVPATVPETRPGDRWSLLVLTAVPVAMHLTAGVAQYVAPFTGVMPFEMPPRPLI